MSHELTIKNRIDNATFNNKFLDNFYLCFFPSFSLSENSYT